MELRHYEKGAVIFRENEFGNAMYEIKSGRVGIYLAYGKAEEKKLTELEPGRIFGEMAIIEVYPRSATAVALEDTDASEISTADLQQYFRKDPQKLLTIMRGLSRRVRELTADYNEVCDAIGEWKSASESGREKSRGLLGVLKKFARAYADSLKYVNRYAPETVYGRYYY